MTKSKEPYNPVTAPVDGVDQEQRKLEIEAIFSSGDPRPRKIEAPQKNKHVIFNKFGIKISR
jgi:hypothetical protein